MYSIVAKLIPPWLLCACFGAALVQINAVFHWIITSGGKPAGEWTVNLKGGASVKAGAPDAGTKANTTITVSDDDFVQLAMGKANAQKLFMSGKLKVSRGGLHNHRFTVLFFFPLQIKGNIMLAQKMGDLFKKETNKAFGSAEAAAAKIQGASGGGGSGLKAEGIFAEMGKRVGSDPALAKKVNAIFEWHVKGANGKEGVWSKRVFACADV